MGFDEEDNDIILLFLVTSGGQILSILRKSRWQLVVFITVNPVYGRHLQFLQKVPAITRCPLERVLDFLGKKDNIN